MTTREKMSKLNKVSNMVELAHMSGKITDEERQEIKGKLHDAAMNTIIQAMSCYTNNK